MADAWDVAIVGGGHNGLVAAAYLARAGRRVVVLERRSQVGGAAATEEIAPGFRASTAADFCGLLRPEIVRDLGLAARGLGLIPVDPELVALGDDGDTLTLFRDLPRTAEGLRTHSTADAAAYPRFLKMLVQLAAVMDPLLLRTPPDLSGVGLGEQAFFLRRALRLRKLGKDAMGQALRLPPMSLHQLLREWFETDLLRATLAFGALLGSFRGPRSPGTAFGLLHGALAYVNGGSWALVRGGMGQLAAALADAARASGATIRTDAEVRRILVEDGRAVGVELASGERVPARAVASNADPQRTFLRLVDPAELEPSFVSAIRAYRATGVLTKMNLALDALPRFAPAADGRPPVHTRLAPSLDYVERAYDDAKYGRASDEPVLDIILPTLEDSGLAPPGKHVMGVLVQYTPYGLRRGDWDKAREKLGEKVLDRLEEAFPGLRPSIVGREILTPPDLEARFGLTGGHVYHGEMSLDQQFLLRPVPGWGRYRTPIDGLWLCGSGAHPGGGVTGAPGYNAAREILRS